MSKIARVGDGSLRTNHIRIEKTNDSFIFSLEPHGCAVSASRKLFRVSTYSANKIRVALDWLLSEDNETRTF